MLDRRLILLVGAVPVGALLGGLIWMGSGAASTADRGLSAIESDLGSAAKTLSAQRAPTGAMAAALASRPLLVLTVGPGALSEVPVRLVGVALTPRTRSALIAFDNQAPEWMSVGQTKAGQTVTSISGSSVELESVLGPRTVTFSDASSPSSVSPTAPGNTGATSRDIRSGVSPNSNPMTRP